MAIYGISFYGSDLYGEPVISVLNVSPFTAESRAPGQVRLRWTAPGGEWSEFRLLRSGYGFAVNEGDGDLLLSFSGPNYQSAFTDTGLAENRFYYYTVFVFDLDTNQWVKAGEVQALTLKDYGNRQRMLLNLPQFYLDLDDQRRRHGEDEGALRRFLRVLSLVADHVQGETESLGWVRDADTVSGGLLPFFANDLGIAYEPEIGMRQMRIWLRNAVYLYKIKGTRLGIEGVATALTGWGADVVMPSVSNGVAPGVDEITINFQANRVNLVPNPTFENDASEWWGIDGTLTQEAVDPFSGASSARLTSTVDGAYVAETAPIPVEAGRSYSGSAHVRDVSSGESVRVDIEWLFEDENPIDTSAGAAVVISSTEYVRPRVEATAPEDAAFARLRVVVEDGTTGDEVRIDAALFEESPDTRDYFDASFLGGDYLWEGTAHASPSHYYFNRAIKNARLTEVMAEYAPLGTTWNFVYAQP